MNKTLKSLTLATSLAVTAGFAGQAMAITKSSQGDLQFVPVSVMNGGWQTEISLINSSEQYSTVSKVVLRSQATSEECLDFMVYLSPGDRFTGTYMQTSSVPALPSTATSSVPTTEYSFYSTDDSVVSLAGTPASAADPALYRALGDCGISYIEIIESAAFDLGPAVVAKATIKDTHDTAASASTANTGNEPVDTISGSYTLMNSINGVKMSDTMDVFASYDNANYLTPAQITLFGQNAATTMAELEAALAVQNLKVPYEHDDLNEMTIATITFPTKMEADTSGNNSTYTPLQVGLVGMASKIRNMSEVIFACVDLGASSQIVSPGYRLICDGAPESLPVEANLVVIEDKISQVAAAVTASGGGVVNVADFTKGWVNITLEEDPTDTFLGAPALTNVIQFSTNANGALNGTVKRVATD